MATDLFRMQHGPSGPAGCALRAAHQHGASACCAATWQTAIKERGATEDACAHARARSARSARSPTCPGAGWRRGCVGCTGRRRCVSVRRSGGKWFASRIIGAIRVAVACYLDCLQTRARADAGAVSSEAPMPYYPAGKHVGRISWSGPGPRGGLLVTVDGSAPRRENQGGRADRGRRGAGRTR